MKQQVQQQEGAIQGLVRLLQECDLCNKRQPTCATNPPRCYPGVACVDTADGPRCGECPRGTRGNGYDCRPERTCADRPCFAGVQCIDTDQGPRCGPCPNGYEGDGVRCVRRTGCEYGPCHPGK